MKFIILLVGVVAAFVGSSPVSHNLSDGYLQFSADVYKKLLKSHSGNFLVCPFSVQTVLALAHTGAQGKTATEISSALHFPENKRAIQKYFQDVLPLLKENKDYELTNANKIYVKNDFKINEDFENIAKNVFQSEIESINFDEKSKAASTMNEWVEDKTNDKIQNLISPDDLDEDSRLVLINALYFSGKWVAPFDGKRTSKKTFYLNGEKETKVNMMENTKHFKYYESAELNAKFLEMPYKGNDISITVVLPNEVDGLKDLEKNIIEVFKTPQYKFERVHVQIPKFNVESKIDFKDILKKLRIREAFGDDANFSGIGASKEPLKISNVVQKTIIEVEEKGTKAAAATAGFVSYLRSGHAFLPPNREFNANHPFVYYLKSPAGILFVGRYIEA